jgi:hypothetical protein
VTADDTDYASIPADEIPSRVRELECQLRQSRGYIARRRWDELERSRDIWKLNTLELSNLLSAVEQNQLLQMELMQNVRAPIVRDQFRTLLDQKLHNMLAAAVSLVDHTRRFLKNYEATDFASEFETRSVRVRDAPVAVFLRDLRNFLLHVGNAPISMTLNVVTNEDGTQSTTFSVKLVSASLVYGADGRSYKWKKLARGFIESNGDSIPLLPTVRHYADLMETLYEWVASQFQVLHKNDTDEADKLVRRLNLTMTRGAFADRESFLAHSPTNLENRS